MTLTTEQLRARAESLGLDFFIERRAGIWVKEWLNDGCTSATAEEVMMWSMLANREAQPVLYASEETLAYAKEGEKSLVTWSEPMGDAVIPLYTAPPAPAVQDGWIPCSEQTPVADGAYWCWFGKEKPSVIQQRVCIWNDRNHEWCDSSVTHWMPLPAVPEV